MKKCTKLSKQGYLNKKKGIVLCKGNDGYEIFVFVGKYYEGREVTMWFLILTVIVLNVVFLFMPKKLTKIEIFSTCMFALVFELIVNIYLDLKLDWYGYFKKGAQWGSVIAIFGIYPAANAIFLNYYQYMKNTVQKFIYIIGCTVFSVVYEYLATLSGYFYYHQWKLWYSAIVYPPIYIILVLVLKFVRKVINRQYERISQ